MNRSVAFLAAAVIAGLAAFAGPTEEPLERYLVVLREGPGTETVAEAAGVIVLAGRDSMPSLRLARRDPAGAAGPLGAPVVFRNAVRGFAVSIDPSDRAGLDALRDHADVAYVAEDRPLRLHDQFAQPGMLRIRVRRSGPASVNDERDVDVDADIAVIDSGIDPTHPDLNVHRSVSLVPGEPGPGDPVGHGTHVAGVAAAIDDDAGIHGVAPGARLWSIRVADAAGNTDVSSVISGLDFVLDNAAQIDVVNLSLGGGGFGDDGACGTIVGDPLHQAICAVVDAGVVVVASAGNFPPYGRDASLVMPAAFDEVITVSAVVETDGFGPSAGQGPSTTFGPDNAFAAAFSNYGWDVDLAAPGVDVRSTLPGGGYGPLSGTSVAAPFVSGAAALWIATHGKPTDRAGVLHVRDELVRLAFPQLGPDQGFTADRDTYREPLLNVGGIETAVFDPVEPRLHTDRELYVAGRDDEATVAVTLRDEFGLPLQIPSNGFALFIDGERREPFFEAVAPGEYSLTVAIDDLAPGNHDLMLVVRNVEGFRRSAGCRLRVEHPAPAILIPELTFRWPVMGPASFFDDNPLHAKLTDHRGAPLNLSQEAFQTEFTGGGPEPTWSPPVPDYITGLLAGVTYGFHASAVTGIHSLPLGVHRVDVTVNDGDLSAAASAEFRMGQPTPFLRAELSANLLMHDLTQAIAPVPLELQVDVTNEFATGVSGLSFLVEDGVTMTIDGEEAHVQFEENFFVPGVYTASNVAIDGLSHGPHALRVRAIDTRGIVAESDPITIVVLRECDDPQVGGGQSDIDGDGVRDECDNCPTVPNPSQRTTLPGSGLEAGRGDACKSQARLLVSNDPANGADFASIQAAVDGASPTSTDVRIDVFGGAGVYAERVVLDRDQVVRLVGRDVGSGRPVVEHAGPDGAVFDLRSSGTGAIEIRDLVVRGGGAAAGQRGVVAAPGVDTRLVGLRFERLATAADLDAGAHRLERIEIDGTVGSGVIATDATLELRNGEFRGLDPAIRLSGATSSAQLEQLLIVGAAGGDGIDAVGAGGPLSLRHATITGCEVAIRGGAGGVTIAHSVVWDNAAAASGVVCADAAWSDLEALGCGGTNLDVAPRFADAAAGDFRLAADSPLLEHGPDARTLAAAPCSDLDGSPRLRDADGDGIARLDPGVFERGATVIGVPEVDGLRWAAPEILEWNAPGDGFDYHVYRGSLDAVAEGLEGTCADDLDADRRDTRLVDTSEPLAGGGYVYVITAEDPAGRESTLGSGRCAERSNFDPCP